MEPLVVALAGAATALASGIGAIPVFLLGDARARSLEPLLGGAAVGVMTVASFAGLLLPAFRDGDAAVVVAGFAVGVAFVLVARRRLEHDSRFGGTSQARARRSLLVFGVLFVHSLPEGFAVGAAWASHTAGLGLFVVLAIGLQNVPEGTAVAIPMFAAGYSRARQFWAAVASSAPQPVGAVAAYLLVEEVRSVLPLSLAFAAGAMLTVVALELAPDAWSGGRRPSAIGAVAGAAVMVALSLALSI